MKRLSLHAPRQREKSKQTDGTPLALFNLFVERVRDQLHVVLAMSPIGDAFRTRLRMFPSLVNCCTIDWFQVRERRGEGGEKGKGRVYSLKWMLVEMLTEVQFINLQVQPRMLLITSLRPVVVYAHAHTHTHAHTYMTSQM